MFIFIRTNEYLYMYKWACLYEQMVIFICTKDSLYMYKWVSFYVQVSICTCTSEPTCMYRTAFIYVQMSIRVQITRPVTNEASGRCCVINDMQNAFSCFVWHIFCNICVIDSVCKHKYKILTNTHSVRVYANAKLCMIWKSCYICTHSIMHLACNAVSSKTVYAIMWVHDICITYIYILIVSMNKVPNLVRDVVSWRSCTGDCIWSVI